MWVLIEKIKINWKTRLENWLLLPLFILLWILPWCLCIFATFVFIWYWCHHLLWSRRLSYCVCPLWLALLGHTCTLTPSILCTSWLWVLVLFRNYACSWGSLHSLAWHVDGDGMGWWVQCLISISCWICGVSALAMHEMVVSIERIGTCYSSRNIYSADGSVVHGSKCSWKWSSIGQSTYGSSSGRAILLHISINVQPIWSILVLWTI